MGDLYKQYERFRKLMEELPYVVKANKINARYLDIPAKKNRVNIFQYHPDRFYDLEIKSESNKYNLGDSLGEVIISFMLDKAGIDIDAEVSQTKHFNCVGTNIQGSYQDATIWGSGILPKKTYAFWQKVCRRKLDIRAVRGPLTREILLKQGQNCPDVYGDPAILMPLIYMPKQDMAKRKKLIIPQFLYEKEFRKNHPDEYMLSMNTNDFRHVIDEIVSSEIVYTSSLHGVILAEAYGVPAVLFRGLEEHWDFKYYDWYQSTGRMNVKIAETYEDALSMEPLPLPKLDGLMKGLLDTFPYDLWEPKTINEWRY